MSWSIRRTLLLGIGAWGRAVLGELRARWEQLAPLLDEATVERVRRSVTWALVEPAAPTVEEGWRALTIACWPPLHPTPVWGSLWSLPREDILPGAVRFPASERSRGAYAEALFIKQRAPLERYIASALDTLFAAVRRAGDDGAAAMPLVCVVAALREELASVALWPLLSLLREHLDGQQLPDAPVIALLSTAESETTDPAERRRSAAVVYRSLCELAALASGGRNDDVLRPWQRDPAWCARLARWPCAYTYLIGREDDTGGLLSERAVIAAAASALDVFTRSGAQEALDESLGALRLAQRATAPFSSLGAASRVVPFAELVARHVQAVEERLVTATVLPELSGDEIDDLWRQADTFFSAWLSPAALFDVLAARWVGRAGWPQDVADPPQVETFGPDIPPCDLSSVPSQDVVGYVYRWRDRARALVHPAALDEVPEGAYRAWLAAQVSRDPNQLDRAWITSMTAICERWHEQGQQALDARIAQLLAQPADLRGLRRVECFVARLLDRIDDLAVRAPPMLEAPRTWAVAAQPLAERLQRNIDHRPLPAALAGRAILLIAVLVGLLWTALPAERGQATLAGPPGPLVFWLLVVMVALGVSGASHVYARWLIGRRASQLAAFAEADVRQWIVYVLWPWIMWPYRADRAHDDPTRARQPAPPALRDTIARRLIRTVTTIHALACNADARSPAPPGEAPPVRETVCPPSLATALTAAAEQQYAALAGSGLLAPLAPTIAVALGSSDDERPPGTPAALVRQRLTEAARDRIGALVRARDGTLDVAAERCPTRFLEDLAIRARPLVRFWPEALSNRELLVESPLVALADATCWSEILARVWPSAKLITTGNRLEACWLRTLHGLDALRTVAAASGAEQWRRLDDGERNDLAL